MQKSSSSASVASRLWFCGLAACDPSMQTGLSPDAQRAAGGAVAGAVIAKALDEDLATGAAIGAVGGALCDDAGVCQRRY